MPSLQTLSRPRLALLSTLIVLGLGCDAIPTAPSATPSLEMIDDCDPRLVADCPEPPSSLPAPWPYFAPPGDFLYQASGDPRPDIPGIWLGSSVTPGVCFADRNPSVRDNLDRDRDWLADSCEFELAQAFAPLMHYRYDPCPGGEPAWAVKYFNRTQIVRIVYLPAYYDDCGLPQFGFGGGHAGDTELILVEVVFDYASQHWQFARMWLSAHAGTLNDRSSWVLPANTQFSLRQLGYPKVWAAVRKHANYESLDECSEGHLDDYCGNEDRLRFPVRAHRNVGSRHLYLMDCVASEGRYAGNGIQECFWSGRPYTVPASSIFGFGPVMIFGGWHPNNDVYGGGSSPYGQDRLNGPEFESRCDAIPPVTASDVLCTQGYDWGPGPNPPAPPPPPPPPSDPWYPPPPPYDCNESTQLVCYSI